MNKCMFYYANKEVSKLAIKVFKMNEANYNEDVINDWADKHNYKITNINVCPTNLYFNEFKTRITDVDLVITVIYHKKRSRKKNNTNL